MNTIEFKVETIISLEDRIDMHNRCVIRSLDEKSFFATYGEHIEQVCDLNLVLNKMKGNNVGLGTHVELDTEHNRYKIEFATQNGFLVIRRVGESWQAYLTFVNRIGA